MGVQIYQKPEGTPSSNDIFIFETTTGSVHFDKRVKWTTLMGLIAAINDLQNYYLKSETYTKTEVNQLIAAIPTFSIEIVQQLPTTDISTTTIYLTPKQDAGTLDYYDEWINLDGTTAGWEWLGKTQVDLSNYYTKSETQAYVEGTGGAYIAETKNNFTGLTTTAQTIIGALNEIKQTADGAASTATSAGQTATAAQGTADAAANAAAAAQLTANGKSTVTVTEGQATGVTLATITVDGTPYVVRQVPADATLDGTSTNAVQNAAVVAGLEAKADMDDDVTDIIVALTDEQTTAPGNPVTLTTEQSGGAKSAVVTFTPKQSGSGDPSPDNVRPISGWTELNLGVSGINLCDNSKIIKGHYWNSSGVYTAENSKASSDKIYVLPNKNYYTSIFNKTTGVRVNNLVVCEWDNTDTFIQQVAVSGVYTPSANTSYIRMRNYDAEGSLITGDNFLYQINFGNSAPTVYSPFVSNTTHTATFSDAVYGGTLDYTTGKLIIDYVIKRITYVSAVSSEGKSATIYSVSPEAVGYSLATNPFLCNMLKPSNFSLNFDNHIHFANRVTLAIYMSEAVGTTTSEWATYLDENPLYICYKVKTPTEIQLTPADVNLLKGSNTVWTDGDTVQIKYSKLPNGNLGAVIDYIQKLEARVKALET